MTNIYLIQVKNEDDGNDSMRAEWGDSYRYQTERGWFSSYIDAQSLVDALNAESDVKAQALQNERVQEVASQQKEYHDLIALRQKLLDDGVPANLVVQKPFYVPSDYVNSIQYYRKDLPTWSVVEVKEAG